ncbi:MAG: hypothetical protein ACJ764_14380 [Solirubrobacteraceae bacterium]
MRRAVFLLGLLLFVAAAGSFSQLRYRYQWSLCSLPAGSTCSKIKGATHPRLVLAHAYIGHRIKVLVTAIDQEGQHGQATSKPAGPVKG